MSSTQHKILFISGAGLPAWIWDGVRSHLDGLAETFVAQRPDGHVHGIRDYAEAALESVSGAAWTGQFTVVVHSAGGSFITAMPVPNRWLLSAVMRLAGTRPPESAIRKNLAYSLEEPIVDRLIADFEAEPQSYFRDRSGGYSWAGPRGYVKATVDRELPLSLQQGFAETLGATWTQEMGTGHLPMLENPHTFSELIQQFCQEEVLKAT